MRRSIFFSTVGIICAAVVLAGLTGAPVFAGDPAPFPDFTFKRVKPPSAGTGNRIDVQIDPAAQSVPASRAQPTTDSGVQDTSGQYGWFWETVSPDLKDTGPGRLAGALNRIANPPTGQAVAAPRLQALQDIARLQGVAILQATIGTRVSPALVLAVISVESGGKVDAVSAAGATGLMQLMPDTVTRFGVADALSATDNIAGGVAFLDFLMDKFDRDPILVLAGYNAGENAVATHDGVPLFPETRNYVPRVLAAYQVARGLCMTPPELITDGCVFHGMNGLNGG